MTLGSSQMDLFFLHIYSRNAHICCTKKECREIAQQSPFFMVCKCLPFFHSYFFFLKITFIVVAVFVVPAAVAAQTRSYEC